MTGYYPTPLPQQPNDPDVNHNAPYASPQSQPVPQSGPQNQPSPNSYTQTPGQSPYQAQPPYPQQPNDPYAQRDNQQPNNNDNAGYAPYTQETQQAQPYPPQQFYAYPHDGQNSGQPYPPAQGPSYPPQGSYPYYPPIEQPWNAMCIAGFVFSFIFAPVGLILSIIALAQINSSGEKSKGMAIAGIIIGIVNTLISIAVIVGIVFAIGNALDSANDYNGHDYSYDSCTPGDNCDENSRDTQDDEQNISWHKADLSSMHAAKRDSAAGIQRAQTGASIAASSHDTRRHTGSCAVCISE